MHTPLYEDPRELDRVWGLHTQVQNVKKTTQQVDTGNLQVQNGVFFVPKFVRKFGDKKHPNFQKQREFTKEFEK